MKIIKPKLRSEKAATGLDITTGALVFVLFTTLIFTLYLQIFKQSSIVKIHQDALGYIIQICENIDMESYETTENIEQYKDNIIDEINFPIDRYNLDLSVEKYTDIHPEAQDIVKRIKVSVSYVFDGEERKIEINKIKVKE